MNLHELFEENKNPLDRTEFNATIAAGEELDSAVNELQKIGNGDPVAREKAKKRVELASAKVRELTK